ncbi:hypothetical protein ACEPPN_013993 [Leptodophora sp. 'Broadleaf-Isolate-01']
MSAYKAPVEKLPLAVRKDVRDEWDNKKADLEKQVSELLGAEWKFEVNPLAIYPYAEPDSYGSNSLGSCIFAYFDGLIWHLKSFLSTHTLAASELNSVASTHIVTLIASNKFTYCGTDIVDGKLNLVFHPEKLGTNISHVAQELAATLSSAPQPEGAPSLSYAARHSIKTDYDPKVGAMLEKARTLLKNPKFEFEPGFEAIGAVLKGNKEVRDDWETNLGDFVLKYLESFVDALDREKFGDDDLLREGLEEACEKGAVRVRVVEKLKDGGYNEILSDGGELVIQTTPEKWGTNIHHAAEKLVNIL